jgi:sporulation integral membrane protein YlbJ
MGAKIIGDMRKQEYISLNESKRMLSFCSTSGPTFMIGAVGISMLGGAAYGTVIAVSHYLGALVNGLFFSAFIKKEKIKKSVNMPYQTDKNAKKDMLELFTEAIVSSFKSLGIILAYIVLFMFLTDLIQFSGFLNFFTDAYMKALAKGIFEMTVGCSSMASCIDITSAWKCILCTFMISWGGLSVIGQTMSMLAGSRIGVSHFILVKLSHALFSSIIAFIIMFFVL